ncbi:MAG: DUF6289 family protein [Brevundimonas sp.]|uniref:DUF6289 family protein n=1 Tax=Brevundimonas sp. TaxID=1871086 RepID=UPI003001CA32
MRIALFSISLLGCVLAGSAAQSGSNLPCPQIVDRTYYSDASMTEEIGTVYIDCDRKVYRTGRTSPYFVESYLPWCNCGPFEP